MGPTEAEGEPLVTDGSGHAVTGPEDPLASFLETVQGMVHESPSATVSASSMTTGANSRRERRAARRAAKQARKHEQKLVREERRSARSRRRRPETTQPAAPPAVEPAPVIEAVTPSAAQQRVPAQADEQR